MIYGGFALCDSKKTLNSAIMTKKLLASFVIILAAFACDQRKSDDYEPDYVYLLLSGNDTLYIVNDNDCIPEDYLPPGGCFPHYLGTIYRYSDSSWVNIPIYHYSFQEEYVYWLRYQWPNRYDTGTFPVQGSFEIIQVSNNDTSRFTFSGNVIVSEARFSMVRGEINNITMQSSDSSFSCDIKFKIDENFQ